MDKFLIVKGKAGMSNRILCLLGGILYSQITQRKLIVDWSDQTYSEDGSNIFPQLFRFSQTDSILESFNDKSVAPIIWKGKLNISVDTLLNLHNLDGKKEGWNTRNPFTWSKYRINIARVNYDEDVLVRWSFFAEVHKLRKHFKESFEDIKSLNDKSIQKKLLKQHLHLNENIQQRIDVFKNDFFDNQVIGVHIRYTDRKNPFDKYPEIINRILEERPEAKIFLATDNPAIQRYFKDIYKGKIILTNKWFPKDSSNLNRLHHHPDCPNKFENAVQALVDLYLLGSSDYLICDQRSTFALVAELISDIPESRVIDTSSQNWKRKIQSMKNFMERWT